MWAAVYSFIMGNKHITMQYLIFVGFEFRKSWAIREKFQQKFCRVSWFHTHNMVILKLQWSCQKQLYTKI